jgi:hypothetical protein
MARQGHARPKPAGSLKPAKGKSTERIDGIAASIMAIGRAPWSPRTMSSTSPTASPGFEADTPARHEEPSAAAQEASMPLPICARPQVLIKGKRT